MDGWIDNMTGEKNKYSTLERMAGLTDNTLTTPRHDEMVLELMDISRARSMISILDKALNAESSSTFYNTSYEDEYKVTDWVWEKIRTKTPLTDEEANSIRSRDYTYVETVKRIFNTDTETYHKLHSQKFTPSVSIKSEVPIKARNDFIIGYWDLVILIKNYQEMGNFTRYADCVPYGWIELNIEVKPQIRSFGETLRQINTYRTFLKGEIAPKSTSMVFLRSDDTRFKAAFESQGVTFI